MQVVKNIVIGLIVSFIGSIPLGYLNLIGFQIYKLSNFYKLNLYLLGVLCIEALVIFGTLKLSSKLTLNCKLKNSISIFSFLFLVCIAILTYNSTTTSNNTINNFNFYLNYSVFITGIILSSINFAQIPFWLSWNLYLVNEKYIVTTKILSYLYVFGTILGTYFGMITIIFSLKEAENEAIISSTFFSKYIWLIFTFLALFQLFQIIKGKIKFNKIKPHL